ncbi:PKD domain-containing protein, partial [Candidatus Magnetomorum sp. HK-1]
MRIIEKCFNLLFILFLACFIYSSELCGIELVPNDATKPDQFGHSVDIFEDYAIVGSYYDDTKGSVYTFKRDSDNTWKQQQKLNPIDLASSDHFGWSVDISKHYAFVSTPYDDDNENNSGSVYIFKLFNDKWEQIQKIVASNPSQNAFLGSSISIFENFAIIGAKGETNNKGAAYIFKCSGETWTETQKIIGDENDSSFGCSVSISNNFAIVGASSKSYLFENKNGKTWTKCGINLSGTSSVNNTVSVYDKYAIVGNASYSNKGAAYIYNYIEDSWTFSQRSYAVETDNNGYNYGMKAFVSNNYAFVAAYYNDNKIASSVIYILNKYNNLFEHSKILFIKYNSNISSYLSLSTSKRHIIIGNSNKNDNQGAVYILDYTDLSKTYQISGYLFDNNRNPIENVSVQSTYFSTITDHTGYYSINALYFEEFPTIQIIKYSKGNLNFGTKTYSLSMDYSNQNLIINAYTISGFIKDSSGQPIQGVTIQFSNEGGETSTDKHGYYRHIVYENWSGQATPIGHGYQFEPFNLSFSNIQENHSDQNFIGKKMNISGYVFNQNHQPIKDIQITFTNPDRIITTDSNGFYNLVLDYQWTGSVTPQKTGFTFQPEKYDFYKIFTSRAYMNYTALEQTSEISGLILNENNQPLSGVKLYDNNDNYIQTDADGHFTYIADFRWTGYLKPVLEGYTFTPPYISYESNTQNQPNQDFKGHINKYLIAGRVLHKLTNSPLEGVQLNCQSHDCNDETDQYGQFKLEVPYAWSDTLTIQKTAYVFEPQQLVYQNVNSDTIDEIVYYQETQFDISGTLTDTNNQPLGNVTIYFNNNGGIAVTDTNGVYIKKIPFGWSGIAVPFIMNSGFTPAERSYNIVTSHQNNQNFIQSTDIPQILIVTPDSKNVSSEKNTIQFDIMISPSSLSWTASTLDPWLSFTKETNTLLVQIQANPFENIRNGTISVKAQNANIDTKTIQIIQAARQAPLAIPECDLFNESDYPFSQTITAILKDDQLSSEEIILGNPSDLIAAFVDNECRGYAYPIDTTLGPQFFLTFWNQSMDNETIRLSYFDSSKNHLYEKLRYPIQFKADHHLGSIVDPIKFKLGKVEQNISLYKNWNWISFGIVSSDMSLNHALSSITTNGTNIVSQNGYAEYLPTSNQWIGPLDHIDTSTMYLLKMKHAATLELKGTSANSDDFPLMLHKNWNWISYLPDFELDVNTALSSIDANGVQICGQEGYAEYLSNSGWFGQLNVLKPGCGYIIKMKSPAELHYPISPPDDPVLQLHSTLRKRTRSTQPFYFDPYDYQYQETITTTVMQNELVLGYPNDLLAAFSGDQCRGIAELIDTPEGPRFFLQLWSNTADTIQFKYYSASEKRIYPLDYSLIFQTNHIIGSIISPQIMNIVKDTDHPLSTFTLNSSDYQYQGTITTEIVINNNESPNDGDKLAAFVNNECRGVADTHETPNGIRFFLQIFSNQSEEMTFKFYDTSSNTVYDLENKLIFTPNMTVGSITEPEKMTLKTDTLPVVKDLQ